MFYPQDTAHSRPYGRLTLLKIVDQPLHFLLQLVGEFAALAAKNFHAVVLKGVMRGGDHNACVRSVGHRQISDGRRGDDSQQRRVRPGGADAGGQRRLQHIAGNSGIPPDIDFRSAIQIFGQHSGGGKPRLISQLSVQLHIGHAADAVCSKILPHSILPLLSARLLGGFI